MGKACSPRAFPILMPSDATRFVVPVPFLLFEEVL